MTILRSIPVYKVILQWSRLATGYKGVTNELTIDPDTDMLYRHDETTAGGKPIKMDISNVNNLASALSSYATSSWVSGNFASYYHSHDYAASTHYHDYAATNHNHDDLYASLTHYHDYASTVHYHDYAATNHHHDALYAAIDHDHAGLYYTQSEVAGLIADFATASWVTANFAALTHSHDYAASNHSHSGYASSIHNHNDLYASINHIHDSRYYTENEIDNFLLYIPTFTWVALNYSALGHTHDYAASNHDHSGVYSLVGHTHEEGGYTEQDITALLANYALLNHDHDSDYAAISHTHDYAATTHTHNYAEITHNHDDLYSQLGHTHNYAEIIHNHDDLYSPLGHTHNYADVNHTHSDFFHTFGTVDPIDHVLSGPGSITISVKTATNNTLGVVKAQYARGVRITSSGNLECYTGLSEAPYPSGGSNMRFPNLDGYWEAQIIRTCTDAEAMAGEVYISSSVTYGRLSFKNAVGAISRTIED